MKAIYSADTNSIQKPDSVNLDTGKVFRGKTIPCSEECRTAFKDGAILTEGKDYRLGEEGYEGIIPSIGICYQTRIIAYPIKQDNTNEDELWNELYLLIDAHANYSGSELKAN